jgi:transketolase
VDPDFKKLSVMADILRKDVLEMVGPGHRGHFGGAFSCAEIMSVLYFFKMKIFPDDIKNKARDRFVMSKGHSVLTQYAAMAEIGFFSREELKTLKELNSRLQGHPDMRKLPGIEANTGSLGQGLSIANGMALALKMDNNGANVYVLLGDGELNEGQVWEAAMLSSHYKLDNLTAIIDKNNIQATGLTCERMNLGSVKDKFLAFGWDTIEVDGHDVKQIVRSLNEFDKREERPKVIIAETVKGKGLNIGENTAAFHNNELTPEQYQQALNDVNIKLEEHL